MSIIKCEDSVPIYFDNTDNVFRELKAGANPVHFQSTYTWVYQKKECTTTDYGTFATTTIGTSTPFLIEQKYTYGEITEILLLGSIFFLGIFYLFARLFLHFSVKNIHKNFF